MGYKQSNYSNCCDMNLIDFGKIIKGKGILNNWEGYRGKPLPFWVVWRQL